MKQRPHFLTIASFVLLCFSVTFLVVHLIVKHLYVDAAFAAVVPVLFGLMVHFIRKGR